MTDRKKDVHGLFRPTAIAPSFKRRRAREAALPPRGRFSRVDPDRSQIGARVPMPNVPFRDLTCVDFFVVTANERSLILPSLCAGAPPLQGQALGLPASRAASLCKRRSASAHSPSLPLGIETANQGGSQERKAMPCPINPTTHHPGRMSMRRSPHS
jgi:hypothetical protein